MTAFARRPPVRELPLVRVLWKLGARRSLQVMCLQFFVMAAIWMFNYELPGFHAPTMPGSDVWNYWSAGHRLDIGWPLYQWEPGPRPNVGGDWSFPLLSPPPIAVLWRPLAALPGDLGMLVWWIAGIAASTAFVLWLIARCRPAALVALLLLIGPEAINIWPGNMSTLLVPALGLAWVAYARGRSDVAGALIGFAAVLKLMPILFVWWFILRRDRRAVVAAAVAIAIGAAISILGAGWAAHVQYLDVAREANTVSLSRYSPVEIARNLGAPAAIASLTPYILAALAALAAFAVRHRPGWVFAFCAIGVTFGTPNLRFDSIAWLLPALAPFTASAAPAVAGLARRSAPDPDPVAAPGG